MEAQRAMKRAIYRRTSTNQSAKVAVGIVYNEKLMEVGCWMAEKFLYEELSIKKTQ